MMRETSESSDCIIRPSDPDHEGVSTEEIVMAGDDPVDARRRTVGIKSVRNGDERKEEGSLVGGRRNVDAICVNASNPFHQCSGYCSQRTPNARRKTEGSLVGARRNVDAICVNASNPFHQCSGYCSQRTPNARRKTERAKSANMGLMGGANMEENKKVGSRCVNADNPYHKCSKNCSQRSHKMGLIEGRKSEESRTVKKGERRNVNLKCKYACNPYHTCTEYCSQRIQKGI